MRKRVTVKVPHGFLMDNRWADEFDIRILNGHDEEYVQETSSLTIPLRAMGLLERVLSFEKGKQPELRKIISNLTAGDRAALILHLRRISLGNTMTPSVNCLECKENLNFDIPIEKFLQSVMLEPRSEYLVHLDEFTLKIRPVTGADEIRASLKANKGAFNFSRPKLTEEIVKSCILSAEPSLPKKLSPELLEIIESKLVELDPLASIKLELSCPRCGHNFELWFDIEQYFLEEIEMLRPIFECEVHCIASTYHWTEDQILTLPLNKRKHYCNIINQSRDE